MTENLNYDPAASATATLDATITGFLADAQSGGMTHYDVPDDARSLLSQASTSISKAVGTADAAVLKARTLLADDTMYPDGRQRLAREVIEGAKAEVSKALEDAEVQSQVAEAELVQAARPPMRPAESAAARMDAQMLLDGALKQDGASLSRVLQRLAGRDDAVGALVNGPWIRDYLMSRGQDDAVTSSIETLMREAMLRTSAESSDPKRRAAARAALSVRSLRQARVAAMNIARMKLAVHI